MRLKDNIAGKHVLLRTAEEADAEFILKLRLNPKLNKFLNETDPSVEKQKAWISAKQRDPNDYHMIIQGLDGAALGVIAVYDIDYKEKTFEWGRWIIAENAPYYAAIESALLVYHLAFDILNLELALFGVQLQNAKVISFHKQCGAKITKEDEKGAYFSFSKKDFSAFSKRYKKFLPGAS